MHTYCIWCVCKYTWVYTHKCVCVYVYIDVSIAIYTVDISMYIYRRLSFLFGWFGFEFQWHSILTSLPIVWGMQSNLKVLKTGQSRCLLSTFIHSMQFLCVSMSSKKITVINSRCLCSAFKLIKKCRERSDVFRIYLWLLKNKFPAKHWHFSNLSLYV